MCGMSAVAGEAGFGQSINYMPWTGGISAVAE